MEAGNRTGSFSSPEEVNRIVTDRVSSLHMACTPICVDYLKHEGFDKSVYLTGDPMYDAFLYYSSRLDGSELQEIRGLDGNHFILPEEYYYMTCHRQENTDTDEKLYQIFEAMECLDAPVIYPVHPNVINLDRLWSGRRNGKRNEKRGQSDVRDGQPKGIS